ncbi:GNAT family N-acetyltransferase [Ketobacter sp. MCCC 1A13808]|uniref:GNAT family N-acetyltransferase n=1 Tax=Ketobacter sp. MCCC 1A13808 TaxID=2602738 RepID=UPI0012EB82DD|nr:GNAT family N-acetyltransferase [Ketobacter sp. MCCC 1A13808]MVF13378.1 GNAT family N-acetyltransferase [Ketobacter sp. MCCC 1A13808]
MDTLRFENQIDRSDVPELTQLINDAYRGSSGSRRWTSESHLVQGDRISERQLADLIEGAAFDLISARSASVQKIDSILGCIGVTYFDHLCEFGTFAIRPDYHGSGIGKALLAYAENRVKSRCRHFQVVVLEANTRLIHFYQKLGYTLVGESIPYPVHLDVGIPKTPELKLVVLRKRA